MVFHGTLCDNKSQVSRTLLSILANVNDAVIWMVSTCPLVSMSSWHMSSGFYVFLAYVFSKPMEIVLSTPNKIGITVSFMFHGFLVHWQGLSICLSFRFLWFSLCVPLGQQSSLFSRFSFFFSFFFLFFLLLLLTIISSCLLTEIMWSVCILKPKEFCVSRFHFLTQFPGDNLFQPVASSLILFLH